MSGVAAHGLIERALLNDPDNANLIVEAPIPGTHRDGAPAFNKLGFADLYWSRAQGSDNNGKIAGIRGVRDGTSERDVRNTWNCGSMGTLRGTQPCARLNPRPGRRGAAGRGWNPPHLPTQVLIGELKPATLFGVGGGRVQVENYRQGISQFSSSVNGFESSAAPARIGAAPIDVHIPEALNYRNFHAQRGQGRGLVVSRTRRMWLWEGGEGVYIYFDLAHDLMDPLLPQQVQRAIRAVEGLRQGLNQHSASVRRKPRADAPQSPSSKLLIQRRRPRAARGTVDTRRQQWMDEQGSLNRTFRREFLRTRVSKDIREKAAIDSRLNTGGRMAGSAADRDIRTMRQLLFWSGPKGRFVGRMRFLLGSHFERLQRVFDRARSRRNELRNNFRAMRGASGRGWRAALTRLIIQVAREALGDFIHEIFALIASCGERAMDRIVDRFQGQIEDQFAAEICDAQALFEGVSERLESLWEPYLDEVEEWSETLSQVQWWLSLAATLEGSLRLAMQAVSCLSPPAAGCLWGLAGQVALEVVLELVVGTDPFHEYVVDPVVQRLINDIFGPTAFQFMNSALGPALSEFHCEVPDGQGGNRLGVALPTGISGAALVARRDAWAQNHASEIQSFLRTQLRRGRRLPARPAQIQQFLERVDGWDAEQIRRVLRSAQNQDGSINLRKAGRLAGAGPEGPEGSPPSPEDISLLPRRRIARSLEELPERETVKIKAGSPCGTNTICSTYVVPRGEQAGVELRLVPVEAFDQWFQDLGQPQRLDILQRGNGAIPLVPPTPAQPTGTVPVLELRFGRRGTR